MRALWLRGRSSQANVEASLSISPESFSQPPLHLGDTWRLRCAHGSWSQSQASVRPGPEVFHIFGAAPLILCIPRRRTHTVQVVCCGRHLVVKCASPEAGSLLTGLQLVRQA